MYHSCYVSLIFTDAWQLPVFWLVIDPLWPTNPHIWLVRSLGNRCSEMGNWRYVIHNGPGSERDKIKWWLLRQTINAGDPTPWHDTIYQRATSWARVTNICVGSLDLHYEVRAHIQIYQYYLYFVFISNIHVGRRRKLSLYSTLNNTNPLINIWLLIDSLYIGLHYETIGVHKFISQLMCSFNCLAFSHIRINIFLYTISLHIEYFVHTFILVQCM